MMARMGRSVRSAAAVSTVVLVLAACQPAGPGDSAAPRGTPTPVPSPAETPIASPSPTPGWERVTIPPGTAAALVRVAWTGTRFLAVDRLEGILQASTDGRTWAKQPRIDDGYVQQVVVGPTGLLAVGEVNELGRVAIWHSPDGADWTGTPDAPSLHGRDGTFISMASVVATGTGWLAVGSENLNCVPAACRLVRAVGWTSPDGLAWTRSTDGASMQHAEMTGVVRGPSGYVAVGDAAADPSREDSPIRPAVWTSPDGRTWTRSGNLPIVTAAADAEVGLDDVTVIGDRVVTVGHVSSKGAPSEAFAWWRDGGPWSSVDVGPYIRSQPARLVAVPDGLLALLGTGVEAGCAGAIWGSANGTSWSCLGNDPAFAGATVADAAAGSGVEVLVGSGPDGALSWVKNGVRP